MNNLKYLLSKFENGEKRYRESVLFHKIIDSILYQSGSTIDGGLIKIIDDLIIMCENLQNNYTDLMLNLDTPKYLIINPKNENNELRCFCGSIYETKIGDNRSYRECKNGHEQ